MATIEIKLPELGEGVTEGELVSWLVKVGDKVEIDQALAEMMTDKATVEIPSHKAGVVKELKAAEGDIVPVEQVILILEESAGASSSAPAKKEEAPKAASVAAEPAPAAAPSTMSASIQPPVAASHVLATPSTRRLARESNVDINQIHGTGLAGRVTREDVMKQGGAAPSQSPSKIAAVAPNANVPKPAFKSNQAALEERVALRGIRRKIAENMQLYKQIIPHFSLMDEANVTRLFKMRNDLKDEAKARGISITYLPFVMKAIIATSREFPMFNASIDDAAGEIVYKNYFNIGFAADTPNGLVVPVIKNADQKTIWEISAEIIELANKARAGKLALEDMQGATITITNIGSIGGTYATPIINHPEVAIIGMYKMTDKPIYRDGKWRAIKSMNFSCTADHRLIDGAVAARFLSSVIHRLENPARLMLDMI